MSLRVEAQRPLERSKFRHSPRSCHQLLGAINWLYHWHRENGELGFEPIREATLAFIRGGIGGGGPLAALTQQETISREHRPRRAPVEG